MSQFTLKILRSKNIFLINTFVVMVRNSKPFQFDQILSNKISKMCSLKTSQIILSKFPTQKIRIDGFHNFKMDYFTVKLKQNHSYSYSDLISCRMWSITVTICIILKIPILRKTILGMKISYLQTLIPLVLAGRVSFQR